ncbi:MAG: MerR family transcriptional regulator, partial [Chloroflexota bacterium]
KNVGMRASTLRYYEKQGLLAPAERAASGYRLYDESVEQTLRFIQRAQRLGFALGDIRTLLAQINSGDLDPEEIIQTAEARYFALERQITQLLVLRHEMGLFLQDFHERAKNPINPASESLFDQLISRICTDPGAPSAAPMLDWLLESTGCQLTTSDGQRLIERLKGLHVHIWQEGDAYHILVISQDPQIEASLQALAQLEANCQVHQHIDLLPELYPNDEGYLLICRGDNAFLFARLFLSVAA